MTFSIICQYVTNTYITNVATGTTNQNQHLLTVIIDSANIVKAISLDMFGTAWTNWIGSALVYEENMTNGNQGIFLRYGGKNTNVSRFFTNSFSTNGYANMFSHDAAAVFGGTIYPAVSTNGYANVYSTDPTNLYDA